VRLHWFIWIRHRKLDFRGPSAFFFDFSIFLADFDETHTLLFGPLPIACGRFFSKSPEQFLNYCQKNEKCEIRHFENAAPGSKDSDFRNGKTFNFIWFLHRTTLYLQLDRERFFDFDFNFFLWIFEVGYFKKKKKVKIFLHWPLLQEVQAKTAKTLSITL